MNCFFQIIIRSPYDIIILNLSMGLNHLFTNVPFPCGAFHGCLVAPGCSGSHMTTAVLLGSQCVQNWALGWAVDHDAAYAPAHAKSQVKIVLCVGIATVNYDVIHEAKHMHKSFPCYRPILKHLFFLF